jgi:hypothetical protein
MPTLDLSTSNDADIQKHITGIPAEQQARDQYATEFLSSIKSLKQQLGAAEAGKATAEGQLAALRRRDEEDRKEAVSFAIEAAKTFIAIASGLAVAILAFYQFVLGGYPLESVPIIATGGSALLALFSMGAGFNAISSAYKRAAGSPGYENDDAWDVSKLKTPLGLQGVFGLLAILALAVAAVSAQPPDQKPMRIVLEGSGADAAVGAKTIVLERQGQNLVLKQPGALEVDFGTIRAGESALIEVLVPTD